MQVFADNVRFTWQDPKSSGYCTFQKERMDGIEKKLRDLAKKGGKLAIREKKTAAKKSTAKKTGTAKTAAKKSTAKTAKKTATAKKAATKKATTSAAKKADAETEE